MVWCITGLRSPYPRSAAKSGSGLASADGPQADAVASIGSIMVMVIVIGDEETGTALAYVGRLTSTIPSKNGESSEVYGTLCDHGQSATRSRPTSAQHQVRTQTRIPVQYSSALVVARCKLALRAYPVSETVPHGRHP